MKVRSAAISCYIRLLGISGVLCNLCIQVGFAWGNRCFDKVRVLIICCWPGF